MSDRNRRMVYRRVIQGFEKRLDPTAAPENDFLAAAQAALSRVYGGAVRLRRDLYRSGVLAARQLPCRVVSIGNVTIGGTGKTPLTMYVARLLKASGHRPCIVSRGYRGTMESCGGVVSDHREILATPESAGDEPYLLARRLPGVPVVVGKDRYAAGEAARKAFSPDVIVLDDGFQHLRLHRDLDLVLLDAAVPLNRLGLLPAGPLREPLTSLADADAVILREEGDNAGAADGSAALCDLRRRYDGPVFSARMRPYAYLVNAGSRSHLPDPASLPSGITQRRAFAFSGIAQNHKFRYTLSDLKIPVCGSFDFPDHYLYDRRDIEDICRQAEASGADLLATTEKDFVRFFHRFRLPLDLLVAGVEFDFGRKADDFAALIRGGGSGRRRFRRRPAADDPTILQESIR